MKLQNSFRDYTAESSLFVRRALVAFLGILLLTGVLVANLYNVQIVRFNDYQTRSNENRIKLVPIPPSRGIIYDRNGTAHKYFASAPYKIAAKSGTAQVFGLKANETYNAHRISERLRDHKLMTAFAPYNNPQVAVAMILENGGAGPAVGTIMRQILDHIMLGDNNTTLPSENPAVTAGEDQ